jgi:hypothetical protein
MGLADSDADADAMKSSCPPLHLLPPPLATILGHARSPRQTYAGLCNTRPRQCRRRSEVGLSLDHAHSNPDRGLNFDLSLSAISSGGEGWVDWNAAHGLGGQRVSTEAGVGKYAGDGSIDPSVLGGGGLSPSNVDDYSSSHAGRLLELSRVADEGYTMNNEKEQDVMGLLFAANTIDEDFVPRSGLSKGKDKSRAVPMDGVVDPPESAGAPSSTRVQRKRHLELFPDETEAEHRTKPDDNDNDGEHESEDGSRAQAISTPAPGLLNARPRNADGRCRHRGR